MRFKVTDLTGLEEMTLEYFFTTASAFAYLGHARFMEICKQHEIEPAFRPVKLIDVFADTGGLPLGKRHPARQKYRLIEMRRWSQELEIEMNTQPAAFPFNATLADCIVVCLSDDIQKSDLFVRKCFDAIWKEEKDLGAESVVRELLDSVGLDSEKLVERASSKEAEDIYERNTREAIERGIFGSPSYVLNGELFWGQDRLQQLEQALESKRDPIIP